jgi:predicted nucleic acid-binding protein
MRRRKGSGSEAHVGRAVVRRRTAAGLARASTPVAFLVDTNVLVYRFDARLPEKKRIATNLLREGLHDGTARLPHQALVEFVTVVTRSGRGIQPLMSVDEARREAEELLSQFVVLWPTDGLVRTALRGAAAYGLPWFDAHLWAYAEHYGLSTIVSEDFQHGRLYGSVRAVNPFHRA